MHHRVRVSKDEAVAALEIPGVRFLHGGLVIPDNAIEVVRPLLPSRAAIFPPTIQGSARAALSWLRPGVPERLTAYQREGLMFALSRPNESAMLVHPTGSGKTLSGIVWALARPGVAVVVTKAAVVGQWASEVTEWSTAQPIILEGRSTDLDIPVPITTEIPQFVILSYSILAAWIDRLVTLRPVSVVFDESTKAKAHKRWDAIVDADDLGDPSEKPKVKFALKDNVTASAMRLARSATRRLATSATPIQDRVRDLWAQLDLVQPGEWGPFWPWARRYCAACEGIWGGMEAKGSSNIPELKARLRRVAHYVAKEVVDAQLPGARRRVNYVRPEDQSRPDSIAKEIRAAAKRGPSALLEMRLMEAAARKRRVVVEKVAEALASGDKVVVFTGRRIDAERLGAEVEKASREIKDCQVWTAHGGHDPLAREEIRKLYMAKKGPCCLVGTGDSWGEGLNLQDTDLAIFAMLPYTPGQVIQWEGRFTRLGQKRPVLILYYVAQGTVDEHVASILLQKLPAVESLGGSQQAGAIMRDLIGDEEELIAGLVNMIGGKNGEVA